MRSDWHTVPLRTLVGYISKGIAPAYTEEPSESTITVLNQKCNRNFRIGFEEARLHDTAKKRVPTARMLLSEDILINSTGAGTAGRIAQIEYVATPTTVDGHMIILRSNGIVTQKYLGYALKDHQYEVLQLDEGSTGQTELNRERLLDEIMISYPEDKDEQNAIVQLLESIDQKIITNSQINDNLFKQLHLLYEQIFATVDMAMTLGAVIETTSGGTPSRKHDEYFSGGSIGWVKSKELQSGYIYDTEEHINSLAVEKSAAKIIPSHSILIAMYGATVGAYGIISKPMACNQAVCALLSNENYPYTYLFQLACESQRKLANLAVGSAQQNISQILIKQLPIHSDVSAIQKFHVFAQPIHEKIESLQAENIALAALRDALLPHLMSGEIDVSSIQI